MTSIGLLPALLATAFALQPPGTFHRGEPVAHDGERWLALRVDTRGAALIGTTLHVRVVEDPVLDAPGERSGRAVGSPLGEDGIVAFVRGPGLHAGTVAQATVAEQAGDAAPVPARAITWRGRLYRLDAHCDAVAFADVEDQPRHRCRFTLASGERRQTLLETTGWREPGAERVVTDASARVLFAGDLDRDGRLDLIIDRSDHYNIARPTLLLSSQAADGEFVGIAATYESVGC